MIETDVVVRPKHLPAITGLSSRSLRYLRERGDFPAGRRLTPKAVGWFRSEIMDWLNNRPVDQPHRAA